MALTEINGNKGNQQNQSRGGSTRQKDQREDTRVDSDKQAMEEDATSIRQNIQNPYGSNAASSRTLTALDKYVKDYIASKKAAAGIFQTFVVEKDVAVPAVVVAIIKEIQGTTVAITHPIMLVDNSNPPAPLEEVNHRGINYRHTTVWADALDDDYNNVIADTIERELGIEITEHIKARGTAIDYTLVPTEKMLSENSFQSNQLDNLILAIISGLDGVRAIEESDTSRDVKPENRGNDTTVLAEISLTPSTSTQATGEPLAEDFMIKVSEVPNDRYTDRNKNKAPSLNNRNAAQSSKVYGIVSGRIDFAYVQPEQPGYRPAIEDSACTIPEFIVAGFDVIDTAPSLTLLMQLVSSVGILDTQNPPLFLEAFDPQTLANNSSRNLGGLHAEVVDPESEVRQERIQFPPSTDPARFNKFVRATIQNRSAIAIEVPSHGPLAGLLALFENAANYAMGDRACAYANDLIIEACDVLTGGEFKELWDNGKVMQNTKAIIPVGHWIDANQIKRDSREFGYLYYLNLDNPQEAYEMAVNYDRTFQEEDQLIAAHERKQLIEDVQGKNFVQTDNVARVYFDPDFYDTLLEALNNSGMGVAVSSTRYAGRGSERRRVDDSRYIDRDSLSRNYQRYTGRTRDDNRNSRRRYGQGNRNWR